MILRIHVDYLSQFVQSREIHHRMNEMTLLSFKANDVHQTTVHGPSSSSAALRTTQPASTFAYSQPSLYARPRQRTGRLKKLKHAHEHKEDTVGPLFALCIA